MQVTYNLKKRRKSLGMTQKYLSKRSGVSKSMISAIENEERNPTIPVLCRLAKALGVNLSELINFS